jgi:hypothetical protein
MTSAVASSATRICIVPIEVSEAHATRVYRLGRSFPAVHFEEAGKGRIVFLPEGAELRIIRFSRLRDCFEVNWEDRLYSMFIVDLMGPWSNRIEPIRARAAGACA